MSEKIKYTPKAVIGQRQMLRRAKEAELSLVAGLHGTHGNSPLSILPSPSLNNVLPQSPVPHIHDWSFSIEPEVSIDSHIIYLNDEQVMPITDSNNARVDNDLKSKLIHWATIQHQIPHNAVDNLLKILTPFHPDLPKNSRTLYKTPKNIDVTYLETGQFVYLGLLSEIKKHIKLFDFDGNAENREISLSFNIDGLPLFKSSNTQLWPILALVKDIPNAKPFPIALFCGKSKPAPLHAYLVQFVDELVILLRDGFSFENINYTVRVHSFICDAPARAFIKSTKQHGGYSACDKCTEQGEYLGRVIYQSVTAPKRTNESFRAKLDEDHHVGESPLLALPIDLIKIFPIDYMHNICLGVMRKLLNVWISGGLNVRLRSLSVNSISEKLIYCSKFIPIEFNRKPRSLTELARWKATEYRMFLLYVGPLVLKKILPRSLYENFLLFHSAITILCSKKHINEIGIDVAQELLLMFINHSKSVYGLKFLVYNVHLLCHVGDDVRIFGPLDEYSAFPFENFLNSLKKLVRSPNKPLQQIVKRLKEMESPKVYDSVPKTCAYDHYDSGPVPEENVFECFKRLVYNKFTFYVASSREADCYCLIKNSKVFKIFNILKNGCFFLYGREFMNYQPFYEYPFNSVTIDVMEVKELSNFKLIPISEICTKCVVIPDESYTVSIPLLHN